MLKSLAREVLGVRTLALMLLAAVGGAVAMSVIGVMLVGLAMGAAEATSAARAGTMTLAGIVYGACGAWVGAQVVVLRAMRRAVEHVRPALRPQVELFTAGAIDQLPGASRAIEPARIDAMIDAVFDGVRRTSDLPVLRQITGAAATVARWRVRRQLEPLLEPLAQRPRATGAAIDFSTCLNEAICSALLEVATAPLARLRAIAWLTPLALLLIPLVVWIVRAAW